MMKVKLDGVAETLLIPLWARAYETKRKKKPLVNDPWAVSLIEKIDYDFDKFENAKNSQRGTAVRSNILDRETKSFIKENPEVVCINLACGLDTRYYRVDNGKISWYNLDLPEVIELRRKLLPIQDERIHEISASMFNREWIAQVEAKNKPVLIILEGAAMYFTEEQIKQLLTTLIENFSPALMLLEIMPSFMVRQQKHHDSVTKTNAHFVWGVDDGHTIEKLHPRIHFCWQQTLYEGYRCHWGVMGALSLIPWWNKNFNDKIVCLELV